MGVAEKSGGDLTVFKSNSLAVSQRLKVAGLDGAPSKTLLTFGGQGRFIVHGSTGDGKRGAQIQLFPLELTAEQKDELKKADWSAKAAENP